MDAAIAFSCKLTAALMDVGLGSSQTSQYDSKPEFAKVHLSHDHVCRLQSSFTEDAITSGAAVLLESPCLDSLEVAEDDDAGERTVKDATEAVGEAVHRRFERSTALSSVSALRFLSHARPASKLTAVCEP
mmetsp:Transcript_63201/g.110312  ORF Transcript_63201/g.110312 Transcript_63201/m.110312 type:complete len:131 (-) Transcript_63201:1138-1530(-)